MRPVTRGIAPHAYDDYRNAKSDLVERLGPYCSYCERHILANLAIEHILPKGENLPYVHLRNEWTNFLLSCVNCNAAKGIGIIDFHNCLLPDRDNTFHAFQYEETGLVSVNIALDEHIGQMAENMISLVSLNLNHDVHLLEEEGRLFAALERCGQRIQVWVQAREARTDFIAGEVNVRRICAEAAAAGFFSIWMAAFEGFPEVLCALVQRFPGTAIDCFNVEGAPISPRPANELEGAGKI